ncbi:thiol-disulfide oxidoreductase DCC family protein [Streptomyces sp. NPDC059101]|uniref:thiol-disulfide oxidoreductase DCC family protein n=1 Tax=Streptomyces sp. NPDC059101 TaxID=3346728 RepID=UPI0036C9E1EC
MFADRTDRKEGPVTSPIIRSEPLLVFDGDCGFCQNVINRISSPGRPSMEAVPWQSLPSETTRHHTERLDREVLLLRDGHVLAGGADALAVYLRHSPRRRYRIAGAVITFPGVIRCAHAVYRWVARNRHRMPGGTHACRLSPPQP